MKKLFFILSFLMLFTLVKANKVILITTHDKGEGGTASKTMAPMVINTAGDSCYFIHCEGSGAVFCGLSYALHSAAFDEVILMGVNPTALDNILAAIVVDIDNGIMSGTIVNNGVTLHYTQVGEAFTLTVSGGSSWEGM